MQPWTVGILSNLVILQKESMLAFLKQQHHNMGYTEKELWNELKITVFFSEM